MARPEVDEFATVPWEHATGGRSVRSRYRRLVVACVVLLAASVLTVIPRAQAVDGPSIAASRT